MKKIIALALSISSTCALADLKTIDFLTLGDGLLTHDTISGLYWLDLSYTSTGPKKNPQMSYLAIQQKTQTLGHPLFGFNHATIDQVREFYTNAEMQILSSDNYVDGFTDKAHHYMSKTGVTYKYSERTQHQYGYTATTCREVRPLNFETCPFLSVYDNMNLIAAVGTRNSMAFTSLAFKVADVSKTIGVNTGHYLVTHYNPTKIVTDNR
jgi:hypothetical protein